MIEFPPLTSMTIAGFGLAAAGLYVVSRCLYLLFFHPLAKYPGPKLAAITEAWWAWMITSGRSAHVMHKIHRQYGDIVRIAPNELSFATPQSYQDIYGHVSKERGRFLKTEFYDSGPPRIVSARDPEVHARMRKAMSHAFSAKALRDQEVVVHQYVDLFLQQLSNLGEGGKKAINACDAYNWLTFDIIGDLAFGESFNAVADGKTNFWISLILDGVRYMAFMAARRRLTILRFLEPYLVAKTVSQDYQTHLELSQIKARKRIESGGDSRDGMEDFFGHMIRKKSISEAEMVVQARTLIIAGSETTAAALSAITFFLVRNPDCLAELKKEVRTTFESSDQITGESTTGMKYLFGVIEEGLRLFPPVAFPPARHSPGAVVDGHYIPAGVTVSNNNYEMSRDPRYWQDPESYRPERWIKDGFGDNKKASQPFSIGSRACIGINLAYLELRIILAKVVLAYDMELESKHLGNWNDECKIYLLWKRPDLLVRYVPVIKTSP